jgi:chemotaxis protein CheC
MSGLLTPLQHDALCEIFNISVGQAAAAMSGLVGEEVSLSVPSMRFAALGEAGDQAGIAGTVGHLRYVECVYQHFQGSFEGEALLMFPNDDGTALARLMMSGLDPAKTNFSQLVNDALGEIGNILLNACLSALADLMGEEFEYSLPSLSNGSALDVLAARAGSAQHPVLFLHIQFLLESQRIEGYMAFVMNLTSLDGLRMGIDRFLGHLGVPPSRMP